MLSELLQEQAALYAAGVMTSKQREEFEMVVEVHDELRDFVRGLLEVGAAVTLATRDRSAAEEYMNRASAINEQLASSHDADSAHQIAWLESELNCAKLVGFVAGQAHLRRVAEIKLSLPDKLPSDPLGVYRLACYLMDREPLLEHVD